MNPENEHDQNSQPAVNNSDTSGRLNVPHVAEVPSAQPASEPFKAEAPPPKIDGAPSPLAAPTIPSAAAYESQAPRVIQPPFIVRVVKNRRTWIVAAVVFALLVLTVVYQFAYSSSRLPYNTVVDGVEVGGLRKSDAVALINKTYGNAKFDIYLGANKDVFKTATMNEAGISALNKDRVNQITYPWYLRLVPFSILWAGSAEGIKAPSFSYDTDKINSFVNKEFGKDCKVLPKSASLKIEDTSLKVQPSVPGGICETKAVEALLASVTPNLNEQSSVTVETVPIDAVITDEMAQKIATSLNQRFKTTMPLKAGEEVKDVARAEALGWLDFTSYIPPADTKDPEDVPLITYEINQDRFSEYLSNSGITRALSVKAGVNKVSTLDYKETSRDNGKPGLGVDFDKTIQTIEDYIAENVDQATVVMKKVLPTTEYDRKYTPTNRGFSALLQQFAQDNKGIKSASFLEVGQRDSRQAEYNGNKVLPAAGIENLYVEYATLVAIESNVTYWGERILGSLTVEDCFERIVETNDRECSDALIKRLSFDYVTTRLSDTNLKSTSFAGAYPTTTANDLRRFLAGMYDDETEYRVGSKLIANMKNTRSRDGIPEGVAGTVVSNSVGDKDTVLNEAAIVNSRENGKYILTVMTDGSNWEAVAELAALVQELHARDY